MDWLNRIWNWVTGRFGPAAPKEPEFRADLSLILDAPGAYKDTIETPFLRHYHKGNKNLYYIASTHASGVETDTFKMVKKAIEEYKPDIVVVEGLKSDASKQYLQDYIEDAKRHDANGFANSWEGPYAALLAERNHIKFTGGEPTEDEAFLAGMKTQGYSAKDVLSFCLVRQMHYWKQTHLPMDEASVEKRGREFLAHGPNFGFLPPEERPTFEEFKAWYDEHNDKPERKFADFSQNDTGPMNTPEASYFNKLSYAMGQIRDRNIVATIGDALEKHNRVLVVYGSYHHFVAKPVFEKMFRGKGEIIQMSSDKPSSGQGGNLPEKTVFADYVTQRRQAAQPAAER